MEFDGFWMFFLNLDFGWWIFMDFLSLGFWILNRGFVEFASWIFVDLWFGIFLFWSLDVWPVWYLRYVNYTWVVSCIFDFGSWSFSFGRWSLIFGGWILEFWFWDFGMMDFGILEFGLDFGNLNFLESEKVFASWIDISILDPARVYLSKKSDPKVFTLKPS